MTLDLGSGSYFSQDHFGYDQQNAASGLMNTDSRAVLFVFRPYRNQFGDVGMRPFQYHFDDNFLNETQSITDLSKRGSARAASLIKDLMSSTNLNDHMMPTQNAPLTLRTSLLSDNYRFILVLTEKASGLVTGNTIASSHGNSAVRRIYTGFFQDEPFNAFTASSSKKTLNPNAYMVITHKTMMNTATEHGRFGPSTMVRTQVSEEVLNSTVAKSLMASNTANGSHGLFLMTPENCINSIDVSDDGYSMAVPGAHSNISNDNGNHIVNDILEQPAHNVAQIVKGLIRHQDDVTNRSRLSTHRADSYFADEFLDDGLGRMKLARHMQLPRSRKMSVFDLDVDQVISPVDLDDMVSHQLDVVDFDLERPQYYETADQMEASITNQYSFLIASVISPILNSAGLNAIQFEYQVANMRGAIQDDFRTHSAEPNWPVPQPDLLSMVKAVEVELVQGIFSTIFHSKGAFQVMVSANTTGMTIVRLSLVDQGYRNTVDFEIPSCMGGLTSPLIGDININTGNSEAIEGLYGAATGIQPIEKGFNGDDHNYMNDAERLLTWNGSLDNTGSSGMHSAHMEID